jgi:hypothetical protein
MRFKLITRRSEDRVLLRPCFGAQETLCQVVYAGSDPNYTCLGRSSANRLQWSADRKRRVELTIYHLDVFLDIL